MIMKKALLWLLILALLLPCAGLAQDGGVSCKQEDTIQAVFSLAPGSDCPDAVMGQLEYDHYIFELLHTGAANYKGGVFIYSGKPVTVSFKVNKYAPDGEYLISVNVLETADADGKKDHKVSVSPVKVTVGNPPAAQPAGEDAGHHFTFSISDGEATLTQYSGPGGDIVITDRTGGCPVTSIGNFAFSRCSSLKSVTIPSSVKSIGSSAFFNCTSLTSVMIPDSVTSIGNSAFSRCSSLTSVTIPDTVTSIRNYAFENCSSLTSVTIPDTVTSIRNYAFKNCSSLTSVTIPDSVKSIGSYAFKGCSNNLVIKVPKNSYALQYCKDNNLKYEIQ